MTVTSTARIVTDRGERYRKQLASHFGNKIPEIIIEPGRSLVGEAGVIQSEVVLISKKDFKDKRRWVKGLKDRLRAGFNVSVAETEDQDMWNASTIAVVTVSGSRSNAAKVLESAERASSAFLGPQLVSTTIDWLA